MSYPTNLWQIVGDYGSDCHAGPKAQRDVTSILSKLGYNSFVVRRTQFGGVVGSVLNRVLWWVKVRWLRCRLPTDCVVFMQYPSAAWSKSLGLRLLNISVKQRKRIKLVVLIHDVSSLRWGDVPFDERVLSREEDDLIKLADLVIVHNEQMKAELSRRGIHNDKMIALNLFDYLTPIEPRKNRAIEKSVVVAGNLNPDKAGYLDELVKIPGVDWRLYGVHFDSNRLSGGNVHFEGCFTPEELPEKLNGSFGLVWDGPSAETCTGDLGNYLRINNPHKLSLFVASGLPVVIWSGAAEADFVKANHIGVCIDSLYDLPSVLQSITESDYQAMLNNACDFSVKVRSGAFISTAVESCIERIV